MKAKILSVAHHRNGVSGAPFSATLFRDEDGSTKVAILFDDSPEHTAVLEVAKLAAGDVEFGSNSWRGDVYQAALAGPVEAALEAKWAALDSRLKPS